MSFKQSHGTTYYLSWRRFHRSTFRKTYDIHDAPPDEFADVVKEYVN